MSDERVLVAGVGNTLLGDDAFGVFAVRELEERGLSGEIRLADFGGRTEELASEIRNGYDAIVLLEASSQGGLPGTLYVFDPDTQPVEAGQAIFGTRSLAPEEALRVLDAFDGYDGQFYIVGCEPESFDSADELSKSVESAVPRVAAIVESLVEGFLTDSHSSSRSPAIDPPRSEPLPAALSGDVEHEADVVLA